MDNETKQQGAEFSLDDILAEFSGIQPENSDGWNDPDGWEDPETLPEPEPEAAPKPEPEPEPEPQPEPMKDIDDMVYTQLADFVPEPAEYENSLAELLSAEVALDDEEGSIIADPFQPLPNQGTKSRDWDGEVVAPTPEGGVERRVKRKKSKAADTQLLEDRVPLPNAVKSYSRIVRSIWPRLLICFFLCLVPVYITIADAFELFLPSFMTDDICKWVLVGINGAVLLLSYEVMVNAVLGIIKGRFTMNLAAVLATVAAILQAVLAESGQLPYCAVTTLSVFFAQWGYYSRCSGVRRSLRVAMASDSPWTVIRQEDGFESGPAFFKTKGEVSGFVAMTEAQDCAEKVFGIYAPIAILASVVFTVLCVVLKRPVQSLFGMLAACLCASLPMAGALCYAVPFSSVSKRLAPLGAALGGWPGACIAKGKAAVVMTDEDLFPKGFVTIEGLKIFGDFDVSRVVGYSTALIVASGSCLSDLFTATLEREKARMPYLDVFQTYEGGGLSAEINGDLVFVGTARFMTLENVKIPQGNKVRSGVYIAINGQLAGLFALKYKPSKAIAYTIGSTLREKNLKVVMATRDFNITPTFMRQNYNVNCDNIEVPTIEDRVDLSEQDTVRLGSKAAIASKDGFTPFGDAVVGGRQLYRIARFNTAFALVGGIIGLLLVFYLGFMGAPAVYTPGNVLVYALAWAVPVLLVSAWTNKY